MSIDTSLWEWPQWTFLCLFFLGFIMSAAMHGKPRIQWAGEEKGQPERYSAFGQIGRIALWMFILIAGGFYQ